MELGDDMGAGGAFEMGEACAMFNNAPGIYNVTATISMVGETVTICLPETMMQASTRLR